MSTAPNSLYRTRVSVVQKLTPHFTRITVSAPELEHFGAIGLDQRVKLLIPAEGGVLPAESFFARPISEWYAEWRLLPLLERGIMRTYTARAVRNDLREVDLDFVLHGTEGPASRWASSVELGDELTIIGPDARSEQSVGIEWRPGSARTVLLAGDETAAPAICAILESLDSSFDGRAFIEIPSRSDVIDTATPSRVGIEWLPREGAAHGSLLESAVKAWVASWAQDPHPEEAEELDPDQILWDVPDQNEAAASQYAWLAGEAGVITGLRRHLVRDLGIDRHQVAFMGYWRRGRAEAN